MYCNMRGCTGRLTIRSIDARKGSESILLIVNLRPRYCHRLSAKAVLSEGRETQPSFDRACLC